MEPKRTAFVLAIVMIAVLALAGGSASAQSGNRSPRTASRILYHDGQVMTGWSNVYFIWYGCWTCGIRGSDDETQYLLGLFTATIGSSPYAQILTTYPDGSGAAPSGGLVYSGSAFDASYSHGATLSVADTEDVIGGVILSGGLPLDLRGIYILVASPDVVLPGLDVNARTCQSHGYFTLVGAQVRYATLNNPRRMLPGICGPITDDTRSPNNNWVGDTLVSMLAYALNGIITNPVDTGWFDRYGLEAPDKCAGTYGPTYTTANGATANMNVGGLDFLIQQNWVNAGKGYCGLRQ